MTHQGEIDSLLKEFLAKAVPLWIQHLQRQPWATVAEKQPAARLILGSLGDYVLFDPTKMGQSARAFNALAEGLAVLSFVHGGVTACGLHWEATHSLAPTGEGL